jgi:putative flippase GtrA
MPRYAAVSGISTATTMAILALAVGLLLVPAAPANLAAVAAGMVPSFELNRRWVWGRAGQRSMRGEIIPFVALSAVAMLLSTWVAHLCDVWASSVGVSRAGRVALIDGGTLATFGALWVAQFLILDRWLFRADAPPGQAPGLLQPRRSASTAVRTCTPTPLRSGR